MTDKHRIWLRELTALSGNTTAPVKTGELTIQDLRKVRGATWDARTEWYDIGLELGIHPAKLEEIKKDYSLTKDQFREMLTTWLKMVNPKPTLAALAEALRSPSVGHGHLAERLLTS